MVSRPVFFPTRYGDQLFEQRDFDFQWNAGFSEFQKKKNIRALHKAADIYGVGPLLEISTKSEEEIGRRLSAFSLKYPMGENLMVPMECVYQGSKVFSHGGPYHDLFDKTPRECKRDDRVRNSGVILYFEIMNKKYSRTPSNAFYDWIYIRCLAIHEDFLRNNLEHFDGFTDIEFNPQKSINCQARALAVLISLSRRGALHEAAADYEYFRSIISRTFAAA